MNNNGQKPDSSGEKGEHSSQKKPFGSLKPLTATQIISLIVPSTPVGAGACY